MRELILKIEENKPLGRNNMAIFDNMTLDSSKLVFLVALLPFLTVECRAFTPSDLSILATPMLLSPRRRAGNRNG